ncbi:MAG TPA: hypothetical protein VFK43_22315 [Acidimicrobiales bacterium]|nr:hypothetical protein [Acidimicrobiales bacterium]
MEWDLGLWGLALLVGMAAVFAVAIRLIERDEAAPWMWAADMAIYVVAAILVSEAWFGWATEEDLQPNLDGVSFDEVLLLGTMAATGTSALVRWLQHHAGHWGSKTKMA